MTAWFAVREIAVNRPVENARKQQTATISLSSNLVYKLRTSASLNLLNGKDKYRKRM